MDWFDVDLILDLALNVIDDLVVNALNQKSKNNNSQSSKNSRSDEQLIMDRYCVTRRILDPNYIPKFKQELTKENLEKYLQYLDELIDFAQKANEAIPNEKYFNHVTYQQYFKKLQKLKRKFTIG